MKETKQISIASPSGEPLVEQLHRQFTWQIASGQRKPGDLLPSIRKLAHQLSINMHTVRSAYQRLKSDGLVQTRQGAGTQVLEFDPRNLMEFAGRTRSYTIGVILPGISNPFYHSFLEGVEEGISRERLLLFVCDAHEDPQEFVRYFTQLSARNVDGIIIASFDIHQYLGLEPFPNLPLLTVDWPGCVGPAVNFDLEQAGYQAVNHLLKHGHVRIGLVTFVEDRANVLKMNAGYARALQEVGIALDESLIARVPGFDIICGELGARQLMVLENPPKAIFSIADTLTLGVLKGLKKSGLLVPEQVALASLNDISVAGLVNPGLTTVALPAMQVGLEAMKMLLQLIEGNSLEEEQITLPTELVIRESCGCQPPSQGREPER
jgi:DNA-binding LacI/PurR family transcriptional regulator